MQCCNCLCIQIPETDSVIRPGCKVKLGRFETDTWTVCHGWHQVNGNRPICGWHLIRVSDSEIRSLQKVDLVDIYVIENCGRSWGCMAEDNEH